MITAIAIKDADRAELDTNGDRASKDAAHIIGGAARSAVPIEMRVTEQRVAHRSAEHQAS